MRYLIFLLLCVACENRVTSHTYEKACNKLCEKIYHKQLVDVTEITAEQVCCACSGMKK